MEKFANVLKKILIDENHTLSWLASELNTKPQNLSNKLRRGTITYNDVLLIAEILGYSIKWNKKQ